MLTLEKLNVGATFKFISNALSFKHKTLFKVISQPDIFGDVKVLCCDDTSRFGKFCRKGSVHEVPIKSIIRKAK